MTHLHHLGRDTLLRLIPETRGGTALVSDPSSYSLNHRAQKFALKCYGHYKWVRAESQPFTTILCSEVDDWAGLAWWKFTIPGQAPLYKSTLWLCVNHKLQD